MYLDLHVGLNASFNTYQVCDCGQVYANNKLVQLGLGEQIVWLTVWVYMLTTTYYLGDLGQGSESLLLGFLIC